MTLSRISFFVILLVAFLTAADNVAPSQNPPAGLAVQQVPQFVTIGFDDNSRSGDAAGDQGELTGMRWIMNFLSTRTNPAGTGNPATYDGTPARVSFFNNSTYISTGAVDQPNLLKRNWNEAYLNGYEIGNHTHSHPHGENFSVDQWKAEISLCEEWHLKPLPDPNAPVWDSKSTEGPAIPGEAFAGFRTPFLEYGDNLFWALKDLGYLYDCSIEEGYQPDQDGSNFLWPYTLDNGSPGHELLVSWGLKTKSVAPQAGLWELPNHCYIVPSDEKCAEYGIAYSLRDKIKANVSWFDVSNGKITGFDYNLWVQFKLNKAEVLAVLKNTLDLRLAGNRAPLMIGAHTQYYHPSYTAYVNATWIEAKEATEEFLDYALSKAEVRVVTGRNIIEWMRNPVALDGDFTPTYDTIFASTVNSFGSISPAGAVAVQRGSNQSFTFTPNVDYIVKDVKVNGASVGAVDTYAFTNVTSNQTITVEFVETGVTPQFTITASANGDGTITPAGASTVLEGNSVSYSIAANSGNKIDSVVVDGTSVGAVAAYTFNAVTADHAITAYFSAESTGGNCTLAEWNSADAYSGGAEVHWNGNDYRAKWWTRGDQPDLNSNGSGTNVWEDLGSCSAGGDTTVTPVDYTITASAGTNGSISPAGATTVTEGGSMSYTITANAGYKIADVTVNGTSVGAVASYTFSSISADNTISATFAEQSVTPVDFTITASAGTNGTISPAGATTVTEGGSQSYTIAADAGYVIADVAVNGTSVGAVATYTFSSISADNTIAATFKVESTGGLCDGVEAWDVNTSWTSYTVGDKRTNDGQVWEVTNVAYAIHEPSGPSGYFGWKLIGTCN